MTHSALPPFFRLAFVALFTLLIGVGCSASGTSPANSNAADSDQSPPSSAVLEPPAAGEGIQIQMSTVVEPGVETEYCQFVRSPEEGIYVNRDEVRFTTGSHHVLLYLTPYEGIPTETTSGLKKDTSNVFDCSAGPTADWQVTKLIGGSQNSDGQSAIHFPPNVGMYIPPNSVLLLNAHYINATLEPLEPDVRVNLHTIPESQVEHEGDVLFWYNMFIDIPAEGSARARMRCPVESDITITNIQSHMHARGVGYAAALMEGGEIGAPFYESSSWEAVPVKAFESGLAVPAGSVIDYYCDYENASGKEIGQGPRTTDEMCMLIGSYYPIQPHIGLCSGDSAAPQATQYLGADWVGSGSATCVESLICLQGAASRAGAGPNGFIREVGRCINAGSPAIAATFSAGVRCLFLSIGKGEDPLVACKDEIDACSAL
jgi:hypothetical protein